MKKHVFVCVILALIAAIMMGCQNTSEHETNFNEQDTKDDVINQGFQDGAVYDDLSDRFTIAVYPTKLITDDGKKNIVYSISVVNKTEEEYNNFVVTIAMNKKLDQYIAAGVNPLPITNFIMAAKSDPSKDKGKGADVRIQQLLSEEQFMSEAGLKYHDILELGKSFELWLQWDGGEEKYQLSADVIDETATSVDN